MKHNYESIVKIREEMLLLLKDKNNWSAISDDLIEFYFSEDKTKKISIPIEPDNKTEHSILGDWVNHAQVSGGNKLSLTILKKLGENDSSINMELLNKVKEFEDQERDVFKIISSNKASVWNNVNLNLVMRGCNQEVVERHRKTIEKLIEYSILDMPENNSVSDHIDRALSTDVQLFLVKNDKDFSSDLLKMNGDISLYTEPTVDYDMN